MDKKINLIMLGKKVVVQKTDDYYSVAPIRLLQRTDGTFQRNLEHPNPVSHSHNVCVVSRPRGTGTCDTCTNNRPTSSSHTCHHNVTGEESPKHKKGILKKGKAKKGPETKQRVVTFNVTPQRVTKPKAAEPKRVKRKYVRKSTAAKQPKAVREQQFEAEDLLSPATSASTSEPDLSYKDIINEAIVMDLLDKKYGNLLETELKSELGQNDVGKAASGKLNVENQSDQDEIIDVVKVEEANEHAEAVRTLETILIQDSPDSNYKLFTPLELRTLPEKIFESPKKSDIKEEPIVPNGDLVKGIGPLKNEVKVKTDDSEETDIAKAEIAKIKFALLPKEEIKVDDNLPAGKEKKIWEIPPQDIDFDIIRSGYSPKCESPRNDQFYGFSNNNSEDRNESLLNSLLEIISREVSDEKILEGGAKVSKEPKNANKSLETSNKEEKIEEIKLLEETAKNTNDLREEAEKSQVDISKCDILVLKENGELKSLADLEKLQSIAQEHSYCNSQRKPTEETEETPVKHNLEGPEDDQEPTEEVQNTQEHVEESRDDQEQLEEVPNVEPQTREVENNQELSDSLPNALETVEEEVILEAVPEEEIKECVRVEKPQIPGQTEGILKGYTVRTNYELLELKNRIMEGRIDKEEILEIIESKTIIQYNVTAEIIEDDKMKQQKRDAVHLVDCLKKQMGVMKKTYEYFDEIIGSTEKMLEGKLTEANVKNIFDNLQFVKDIVDKTFIYYDIEKRKGKKVRYKVINITRKETKGQEALKPRPRSNKLLLKMLYRMNKLLESLERSKISRKQNLFVTKLREIAKKNFSKLEEADRGKKSNNIDKTVKKKKILPPVNENCDPAGCSFKEPASTGPRATSKLALTSVEIIESRRPVITPMSKDVKNILSQIEQLNEMKNTAEGALRKIAGGKARRAGFENKTQKSQDEGELILIEDSFDEGNNKKGTAKPATVVTETGTPNEKNRLGICEGDAIRYSQRKRRQTDFYSAEKYISKGKPRRLKVEIDCSDLDAKPTIPSKGRNITFELKNEDKACIVLCRNLDIGKTVDLTETDEDVETGKATKRLYKKRTTPAAVNRQLRSSTKEKKAVKRLKR